jgi:hypothetical protein
MSYPTLPSGAKHIRISVTGTSGTLVAAVAGKKIRVLDMILTTDSVQATDFRSGASTILCGPLRDISTTPLQPGCNPHGHFETAVGEALQFTCLASATIAGSLVYIEVS